MSVIYDAEAWDMVRRLDAKAEALLKLPAARHGLHSPGAAGKAVRLVWDLFACGEFGRDHYPYSPELDDLTRRANMMLGTWLDRWHVWGLLHRSHRKQKNWHARKGQRSPYPNDIRAKYGISIEQMRAMGRVPLRMAKKLGDDVAMTPVITRATNELFAYGNWGDWFDDRFVFNAMLSLRKSGKGVPA
jgi:hypothetical protein